MDNKKVDNIRLLGKLPDDLISTLNTFKNISQDDWLKYNKVKPNRFGVFKNTTEHIVFRFVNDIEKPKSGYFNYNVFDEYESYLQKIKKVFFPTQMPIIGDVPTLQLALHLPAPHS